MICTLALEADVVSTLIGRLVVVDVSVWLEVVLWRRSVGIRDKVHCLGDWLDLRRRCLLGCGR